MTTLIGDLQSIMGTPFGGEGHAVLIFSRVSRAAFQSGAVIIELHDRIPMPKEAEGRFTVEGLDPGPIRVELEGGTVHGHGWNVDLPEEGEWHLADLMDAQVEWSPAVVGRAESAARNATQAFEKTRELRDETEGFRDETFQKADAALNDAANLVRGEFESLTGRAEDGATTATEQAGVAAGHAEQAGEDRVQTAEDRRQTGEDRTQTGEDREAAEGWASQSRDAATLAITSAAALERHVADRDPTADDTAYKGAIWVAPSQVWIRGEDAWHPISANDGTTWHRGDLPDTAVVDDMRLEEHKGTWALYPAQATQHRMPSDGYGILTVLWVRGIAGYAYAIQVWESSLRNDRWTRTRYRDGAWSAWLRSATFADIESMANTANTYTNKAIADALDDFEDAGEVLRYRGFIPEGEDLSAWSYGRRGTWYIPTRAVAESLDLLPVKEPGTVIFNTGEPGYGYHSFIYLSAAQIPGFWFTSLKGVGQYHPWVNLMDGVPDPAEGLEPVAVGMKNRDLIELLAARKGGTIGTGGRAAFALRLDHGTDAFRDELGPILKKYGLPATMAVYSEQNEVNPNNHSVPWAEVQSWHHSHGMSFGNHSDDHLDKPDAEGWYGGTIESHQALRELMPKVPIEQYIPHGSIGYDRYGGFNRASSHEEIVGTLAGRMALSTHALISGYRGGRYRNLTGRPIQGLTHWSMEESTPATFRSVIDTAIAQGRGVAVMFHPEFIGLNGKMTWEQIDECMSYVAQKRDEGMLVPLTLDGLAMAEYRSDYRDDLLAEDLALMRNGAQIYGNFTETPGAFTSSTPGNYVRHLASMGNTPELRGGTRTAEWHISSTAGGSASLSVTEAIDAPTWGSERTVTFSSGQSVLYLPFGIPLDAGSMRIELTLLSGDITIHETHAYAS